MFKFIKNKFLFIILISVVTLILLIAGAITLHKDTSKIFASEGYIIENNSKKTTTYYFTTNTKYKANVDNDITFEDKDNNKVEVSPASFVHYLNGNISFLQKGALVNLADINSPMVSYYNVTNDNLIMKEEDNYTITSDDKKISLDSFIGRISDKKYLIAGNNLYLKVPNKEERIQGDYFEILYIEEGIVKIDNQEASYQVTAQDSYLYIGDNITINLGNGKIFYDDEAKMLLSQITINGNENIDLDVQKNNSSNNSNGNGSGEENGSNTSGEGNGSNNSGEGNENSKESQNQGGENSTPNPEEQTPNNGNSNNGNASSTKVTGSPQIELIDASVTSTSIELTLQLNNATLATGDITAELKNIQTGETVYVKNLDLVNGTFKLGKESLSPSTEYLLTIKEATNGTEKQYFQKIFETKELGITLEKIYQTEDSLSYKIIFDDTTDVTKAHISIYDNNGTNSTIEENEFTVAKTDLNNTITFTGLKSNSSYSVLIDNVWINSATYSNVYNISRIDTTLKQKPKISEIEVTPNTEEVKFDIKLKNVEDKDKAIISYTYNIYLATDITLDNPNPTPLYSVTKTDFDSLILNLNEIEELKTGVDYRCKITAQYNDNIMIREISTDYSSNFLIRSKPTIEFELKDATMNKITGTLNLIDANCTVPMSGRSCANQKNTFTVRYYKLKEESTTTQEIEIKFDPIKLTSNLVLEDLTSNTTYAIKVFGSYYDDDNILHSNVQIGDVFYITTDKSDNIYFEVTGDNESGKANQADVVTFNAKLTAPQNSTVQEEIATITLNLYSGKYNKKEKLIGSYTMTSRNEIDDFFSNLKITNSMFLDATGNNLGNIDTLEKLVKLTANETNTLNSSYTVEIEDVYDEGKNNKIKVENNVYTFNLTPSYYLDTRIVLGCKNGCNLAPLKLIKKQDLTEEELDELSKKVKNINELEDSTIVGIIIDNSLSDTYVDSAFISYEKVVVDYIIYNETTNQEVKRISIDMGNKYQPKEQIIYLDGSELDNGKNYFTRGYTYKIGYELKFTTEDGENPTYQNDKLYTTTKDIIRQSPIYTQYISTSTDNGITYKYTMNDIDNSLANNSFYYKLEDSNEYQKINDSLIADGEEHEVTIPITETQKYQLAYPNKSIIDVKKIDYIEIDSYDYEKEYQYNQANAFELINEKGNTLKIKLLDHDINQRTIAYKVEINTKEDSSINKYSKYFIASSLNELKELNTITTEEGNTEEIETSYKYIEIDYAELKDFLKKEMTITVYSYYDSGLVGLDQTFTDGLILKNNSDKYINLKQETSSTSGTYYTALQENISKGHLSIKELNKEEKILKLVNAISQNQTPTSEEVEFKIDYTSQGLKLTDTKTTKEFTSFNPKVIKNKPITSENNKYQFDTIIPTIKVDTTSTINSFKIKITPSGIYNKNEFNNKEVTIKIYNNQELSGEPIKELKGIFQVTDTTAKIVSSIGEDTISYENLIPDTTYYFSIYATINGEETRLYDSVEPKYQTKTYQVSTLNKDTLLSRVEFKVAPTNYSGDYPEKRLEWNLYLKNKENYKIRFELYQPDGTTINELGEEVSNYKPVNFNGTTPASCDINSYGTANTGYVDNCYISVEKDVIEKLEGTTTSVIGGVYTFNNKEFVFGGNYYKLVVYAIPYTNGDYDENHKLSLFEQENLSTDKKTNYDIVINPLKEATFELNDLSPGYNEEKGHFITFTPTTKDNYIYYNKTLEKNDYYSTNNGSFMIKNGQYKITLKDEKGKEVTDCGVLKNEQNNNGSINYDEKIDNLKICQITQEVGINQKITFTGLNANTLYYVEVSYETYRNNVGYTEDQKISTVPFTDFLYTTIDNDMTLGTITAGAATDNTVTLTYNGSSNIYKNIVKVSYTISLKGGSSRVNGSYQKEEGKESIFTQTTGQEPKLTIDTTEEGKSDNTTFTFKSGNTYIITTQYYYLNELGEETLLEDKQTGNHSFTTILNL